MFKFIGFIAGLYFLHGIFGAFLGLLIGSYIDRARAYGTGGVNPLSNANRQVVFIETLFLSMGKVAKVDGRVSAEEIAHAEALMQQLGMTAEHRTQAIAWFKQGADPALDFDAAYKKFMSVCGNTRNLKHVLLVYLIVIALADGEVHPEEETVLIDIAARLGYSAAELRQLMAMAMSQARFSGGQQRNPVEALDDAYKALGVTKENTDQEIKRAYRKLMSQYHPDKLMGQGLPEDMIAMATEKAKEIQLAHDLIQKSRNI